MLSRGALEYRVHCRLISQNDLLLDLLLENILVYKYYANVMQVV